jgi:PAS domain S-box-containing protein
MPTRPSNSWSTLFLPLLGALLLVACICFALYWREAHQAKGAILGRESQRTQNLARLFESDINSVAKDLLQLSTGDRLHDYLLSGQQADLDRAVRRAVFVSKSVPDYDQIRYLNEQGREVFRVNLNGAIVPSDELQNKEDRPYFQKTMQLNPGQIYLSGFDLNMENGVIEQPLKPMLRFAAPVFDANGRRRGVYIINYLGQNAIDRLRQAVLPQVRDRLRLLNGNGYWLKGASPDQEWGFMLPGRSGMTLAQQNPDLWARIEKDSGGRTPDDGGYFTWQRIILRDTIPGVTISPANDDRFLVIASQITGPEWAATFASLRQTFVIVAALLLILATIITWFFNSRRRAKQEADRFFDLTRDMLCIAGFDGYFKRVNTAWEGELGFTRQELLERPFIDFVHPEDGEKTVAETARLASGEESVSFENRYRCKDGSYRWLLWSARPLMREQVIYASARDMTERKQMEETLRQSEERTRLMVESIKEYAIFMLDPQGRVVNWNPGAERIKGYRAEEIIGQHFSRFYPEEKIREQFPETELREATAQGRFEDEGWRVRKDGSLFWANVVINAVRDSSGKLLGFVKLTRDITRRKEADERIRSLNEELKQRAELLQMANKELEAFSYSVSHDLRAPLRHIHGFVELLQQSPALQKEESSRRYMAIIAKAGKEMGMLIDDLLAFSRTGRAEMHPVKVDMREMIDRIIEDRALECKDRKIAWRIGPLPEIAGDPSLLRLVWTNLLDNAIKYTRPREETTIEIGAQTPEPAQPDAGEVVFFVRDNGVGFDMQYASKLFGVFQRLHRADEFEGTGIGLANVQRIILRHGGRVWAESQPGSGSTFYFSLPLQVFSAL